MKYRIWSLLCFLSVVSFLALSANAQLGAVDRSSESKPEIMFLGTYHMRTPGNNIVNGNIDDISTPERQRQLEALVLDLSTYRPTKIAMECDVPETDKTREQYEQYRNGTYQLAKSETNQIGFRLASAAGLKKDALYCIDWSEDWDNPNLNYEKYAKEHAEFQPFLTSVYEKLKKDTDVKYDALRKLKVIEQMRFINKPSEIEREHEVYFDLMRISQGQDYYGTNYVAWIYRRNLSIFDNIVRTTAGPHDRIFVVYGYGHMKLLNEFARESGFYKVESPLTYLK